MYTMSSGDRAHPRSAARLTPGAVLAAAVALADREGLESVSMRRLASGLGVVPMALYKHIADKEHLVAGMIDQIVAGYGTPPQGLEWRAAVRWRVGAARDALTAHPWLRGAIERATQRTPTVLAHMDAVAGEFRRGGLSYDLVHHAMHALGHRIWGFSPEAFSPEQDSTTGSAPAMDAEPEPPATAELAAMAERYPHIVAIALDTAQRVPGGACDTDAEFTFTLDLLLDAVARLHESGWRSR